MVCYILQGNITPQAVKSTQQIAGLIQMVIYRKLIGLTVKKVQIGRKKETCMQGYTVFFYSMDRLISPRSLK